MPMHVRLDSVRRTLPPPATPAGREGARDAETFAHGTTSVIHFATRVRDHRTSHEQDELRVVAGSGVLVARPRRTRCRRAPKDEALRSIFVAAIVAVVASGGPGPASASTSVAEAEVEGVTQEACDAFLTRDLPTLERLLAPTFTLVGPDAVVQPRSQAIAEVRAGEPRYDLFRNHDMTAQVFADAAIVQGITSLRGTSGGKPFAIDVRFTDTLIRNDGQWRIVVSHVTRIP